MKSNGRYEIHEQIGEGGMGVVSRAFDHEKNMEVALKKLLGPDPAALLHLKTEFRAPSRILHRNLVKLYELGADSGEVFFTMELIRGVHFLEHVRGDARPASDGPARPLREPDLNRLRRALDQLVEGLSFLHAEGKAVHCDVKPSNIMVDESGRVVILDFGLITLLRSQPSVTHPKEPPFGTVAYMAPERFSEGPITPAVDWYSVGVLLYEALTGQLPFAGDRAPIAQLRGKLIRPRELIPDVPDDLDELCVDLLHRNPRVRPTAEVIVERLSRGRTPRISAPPALTDVFVGREQALRDLRRVFAEALGERPVTALIRGSSGIGKSALARQLANEVAYLHDAVVLEGRCYERESVPFKGFDSIVDELMKHLLGLPPEKAAELLPPDAKLLAQIFPVLTQVPAIEGLAADARSAPDQRELRTRAFTALREILLRIRAANPVVLVLDDAQWGDRDSADLLSNLLSQPTPPALMLIACARDGNLSESPLLDTLLKPFLKKSPEHAVLELQLEPLSHTEACHLTEALLESSDDPALPEAIARDAAGNPFFVRALVQHARFSHAVHPAPSAPGGLTLEDVLRANITHLSADERRLLEVIAVAGHPILCQVALSAADHTGAPGADAIARLYQLSFIAIGGSEPASWVEPLHDRIRETVAAGLPIAARRAIHRALARAFEAQPDSDPQSLVEHYHRAGDNDRAGQLALAAAERAARTLAFNRAATLYTMALELNATPEARWTLLEARGEALAHAAKSREAARSYALAAEDLEASSPLDVRALDLRRRAAEQHLKSGNIMEGLAVLRGVLKALGAAYPESPRMVLADVAFQRGLLWLQGLDLQRRDASAIQARERVELETYWSASLGLSMADSLRAAYFGLLHERLALKLRDPINVARALSSRVARLASEGGAANRRVCGDVLKVAEALARTVDDPYIHMLFYFCAGVAAYFSNEFRRAVELCDMTERIARESCTGVAWEVSSAQLIGLWALAYLGELPELHRRLSRLLKEALERDDIFAATGLRIGLPGMALLAADRPDEAEQQAVLAMQRWTTEAFHSQHYFDLVGRAQIDLYRGDAWRAFQRVEEAWPNVEAALLLRLQSVAVELRHLRARCALAAAQAPSPPPAAHRAKIPDRRALLNLARAQMRHIKGDLPWCDPLAGLLKAGVENLNGRAAQAISALEKAAEQFDRIEMHLYATAARLRRAELLGGRGSAAFQASAAWMHERGIASPSRMADVLVPGCPRLIPSAEHSFAGFFTNTPSRLQS